MRCQCLLAGSQPPNRPPALLDRHFAVCPNQRQDGLGNGAQGRCCNAGKLRLQTAPQAPPRRRRGQNRWPNPVTLRPSTMYDSFVTGALCVRTRELELSNPRGADFVFCHVQCSARAVLQRNRGVCPGAGETATAVDSIAWRFAAGAA